MRVHCWRASAELDRAYDAVTDAAAEAHFALSHLHRERLKQLHAKHHPRG